MDNITKIWYGPLPVDSPYVQPFRLYYQQNGVDKNWDLLKVHDSVAIIIFNTTTKSLVFVKQFRPAVYYGIISADGATEVNLQKYPPKLGITLELCAGIVDKDLSMPDIAREEVLEECGYDIPVERLEEVLKYRSGVGTTGSNQVLFYCEVTNADKVASGGGVDDEIIEVVEHTIPEAEAMVQQGATNCSPPSCLLGILWFLTNKAPKFLS